MSLPEARREYASAKVVALSSQLQELSVARFEVDALPDQREVCTAGGAMKRKCSLHPQFRFIAPVNAGRKAKTLVSRPSFALFVLWLWADG